MTNSSSSPSFAGLAEGADPPPGCLHGVCVLLLCLGATAALYLPYAGIPPFGDDYLFLLENPHAGLLRYFVPYEGMGGEFRPFQMAWGALNQIWFGQSTYFLQAGQAFLHALLAYALYSFLRRSRGSELASVLAAGLLAINPIGVLPVLGNDTMSQVGSTLCGFVSFACAWRYGQRLVSAARAAQAGWHGMAEVSGCIVALALALLFKETGLSFGGLVPLTLAYWLWQARRRGQGSATVKLGALLAACVVTTGLYMVYRNAFAPVHLAWGTSGPYDFRIGLNILVNQVFLYVAALLPASTADVFVAYHHRVVLVLAGIGLLAVAWGVVLCAGVVRARAGRVTLGLLIAASCATVPVTLMNRVSELYAYNMLPFLSMLSGLAVTGLLVRRSGAAARGIAVLLLLAVVVSDVVAVRRKAAEMMYNGEAAAALTPQVTELARQLPPQGKLLLLEQSHPGACYYSVFLTTDFHGLNSAEEWIRHLTHRPDISVKLVAEQTLEPADMVLIRDDSQWPPRVRPWPQTSRR